MTDRLEEIKLRYASTGNNRISKHDSDWLIREVERLRAELVTAQMARRTEPLEPPRRWP